MAGVDLRSWNKEHTFPVQLVTQSCSHNHPYTSWLLETVRVEIQARQCWERPSVCHWNGGNPICQKDFSGRRDLHISWYGSTVISYSPSHRVGGVVLAFNLNIVGAFAY